MTDREFVSASKLPSSKKDMSKFQTDIGPSKKNKFSEIENSAPKTDRSIKTTAKKEKKGTKKKAVKKDLDEKDGKYTKFKAACQASYTYRYNGHGKNINKSSPTEFQDYHLVLQKNDKLVLFSAPKKQTPFTSIEEAPEGKLKSKDKFQRKYLACQLEYGNVEQLNAHKQCKPEMVLELGALSIPRVAKHGDNMLDFN